MKESDLSSAFDDYSSVIPVLFEYSNLSTRFLTQKRMKIFEYSNNNGITIE